MTDPNSPRQKPATRSRLPPAIRPTAPRTAIAIAPRKARRPALPPLRSKYAGGPARRKFALLPACADKACNCLHLLSRRVACLCEGVPCCRAPDFRLYMPAREKQSLLLAPPGPLNLFATSPAPTAAIRKWGRDPSFRPAEGPFPPPRWLRAFEQSAAPPAARAGSSARTCSIDPYASALVPAAST